MRRPILLIDANRITRQLIRATLVQHGFAVEEATTGAEGLATAARGVALALIDLRLPDLDGFELAGRLRALPGGADLPILAVRGILSKSEEARLGLAGFDDVVSKPVDATRLIDIVRAHLPATAPTSRERFGAGRKLVVADDDSVQRKLACFRLERLGFEVRGAGDGNAALVQAREWPADAIVSDVLMPGLDGFGLCVAMRQDARTSNTPIVLMTNSYVDEKDRALARRAGANDLLFRTPELDDVIASLRACLAGGRPRAEASVASGPELEGERVQRALSQLDRQVALNAGMAQRCALLSAELSVLSGVSEALAGKGDTDEALREVLAGCLDAGGIPSGALYLTSPWRVFGVGAFGAEPDLLLGLGSLGSGGVRESFPGEQALLEQVIAGGTLVSLPGPAAPAAGVQLLAGLRAGSAIVAPLHHRGTTLGALLLVSKTDELKSSDRVAFAQAVAGQMSQALAVARAFAEREAAARAALAQEAVMSAILESLTEGVIVADQGGRLIHINPAATRLLGGDIAGRRVVLDDRQTPVPPERWPLERAVRGETVERMELFAPLEPGADGISLSMSARPLREAGGVHGAVAVLRDVTAEKAANAQLLVTDRMASVGMLAAGVAHEINNPLAAVVVSLDMAVTEELVELGRLLPAAALAGIAECLSDAREGAARVAEIVRDLRIFTRTADDKRTPVDVRRVLESSIRMARHELRHRARLVEDYAVVPPVMASEPRLGQLFLNLLVNAVQAISDGHAADNQITVRTSVTAGGDIEIAVSDTGVGIRPEIRERLFTPFFTTKSAGLGTGLGLTMCQRIVLGLGGEILVESEVGKGSTFRVILPAFRESPPAPPTGAPAGTAPPSRGRLLVIDDDPQICGLLRRALGGDHEVVGLDDARVALERLASGERFDVILCDLMMPGMTGMDLHDELSRRDPANAAKLVFMTGGAFTPRAGAFLEEVDNPRIEKPFDLAALKALMAERVRMAQSAG